MSTVAQSFVLTGRTEFPFPFPVRFSGHVRLTLEGGDAVNPADYTVVGAGPGAVSVTVVYPTAPADGQLLTISRLIPPQRVTEFTSDREITAAALNAELDNLYQIIESML